MKILLSYPLSIIFHTYFNLMLVLFHPLMVIAMHVFGDQARKKTVDLMNFFLVRGLHLLGSPIRFSGIEKIPKNRPVIIISNHQSMYDIPAVVRSFKDCYPKFISKAELAKNIPSVSHNLRHGNSALIDRTKGAQAVKEIFKLGKLIEKHNYGACIFPEGTRSKTGNVKEFMSAGINTLLRAAPSSVIIPFVIDGHSQLMYKKGFPLKIGQKISYTILDPIEPKDRDIEELVIEVRNLIISELKSIRKAI